MVNRKWALDLATWSKLLAQVNKANKQQSNRSRGK